AHANIAVPLLYGQAIAFARYGAFDLTIAGILAAYGLATHLFLVFANDLADEDADRDNTGHNRFGGGSRVLPEGKLGRGALRSAALSMAGSMASAALLLTVHFDRPAMLAAPLAAVALLWAYSYPPLRLAYRGHGELLQGLGVGVVLPLTAVYAQTGDLSLTV